MSDADLRRMIRLEVERQLNIVLPGVTAGSSEVGTEDIGQIYPGMPTITERPVVHPYGISSRAPVGTQSMTARIGSHPGNRATIGHRDSARPSCDEGETVVYSIGKYEVRLKATEASVGKDGTSEPMVLGDKLTTLLEGILDALVIHTHPAPGAPPTNAASFQALKTGQVSGDKLLAKDGGGF